MRWWPVYVGAASVAVLGGTLGGQAVVAGMQTGRYAPAYSDRAYASDAPPLGGSLEPVNIRSGEDSTSGDELLAPTDQVHLPAGSDCASAVTASCAMPLP